MNNNIALLRNISIIAIVVHHSFCVYAGWPPNTAIDIELPSWVAELSSMLKIIGLSSFTFISGFLLQYQSSKHTPFWKLIFKKFQRVLIPCVIFSCLYGLIFPSYMLDVWPSAVNGSHLWYLPMLFICICITSSLLYLRNGWLFCALGFLFCYIVGRVTNVRTFIEVLNYLPTFICGYCCNKCKLQLRSSSQAAAVWGGGNFCFIVIFASSIYIDC